MTHDSQVPAVLQLRLVVETEDFEAALGFYRDALGLSELAAFEGAGDAHVVILDAGRATLEIDQRGPTGDDRRHRGRTRCKPEDPCRVRGRRRQIDYREPRRRGASLIGVPVETPWKSLNARLEAPAGLQITVFQELTSPPGT